jgi:hypothetical protein
MATFLSALTRNCYLTASGQENHGWFAPFLSLQMNRQIEAEGIKAE